MLPRPTIKAFDTWLAARSLRLDATVVGGSALALTTLGRADLLKTKLFALCDRGTDLADCIAMAPSAAELEEAEPLLSEQDANPMWPDHARATLDDLRGRLDFAHTPRGSSHGV